MYDIDLNDYPNDDQDDDLLDELNSYVYVFRVGDTERVILQQ